MRQVVEDGYSWGCLPFEWNATGANLVVTIETSRKRKYAWYFNIGFYTVYMIYLCGRYLQRQFDESSLLTKLTAEYVPLIYSLALVIRWCIFLRYEELGHFINSFLKFYRQLDQSTMMQKQSTAIGSTKKMSTKKVAPTQTTTDDGTPAAESEAEETKTGPHWTQEKDTFFTAFMTMGFMIRWLDVLTIFTRPELDLYLTSFLPHSAAYPIWQRALLIMPHVYIRWTNWAVLNFTVVYGLAYMRATALTVILAK